MQIILEILLLIVFLSSCKIKTLDIETLSAFSIDSIEKEELRITLINDSNQVHYFIDDDYISFWSPTKSQMNEIDTIIINGIRENSKDYYNNLSPNTYNDYYRQYVCYILPDGDSIAFINAICRITEHPVEDKHGQYYFIKDDWQHNLIYVMDGGDCFWRIWVNFSKKKYLRFIVNGVA